jgi:hypothetical protein
MPRQRPPLQVRVVYGDIPLAELWPQVEDILARMLAAKAREMLGGSSTDPAPMVAVPARTCYEL